MNHSTQVNSQSEDNLKTHKLEKRNQDEREKWAETLTEEKRKMKRNKRGSSAQLLCLFMLGCRWNLHSSGLIALYKQDMSFSESPLAIPFSRIDSIPLTSEQSKPELHWNIRIQNTKWTMEHQQTWAPKCSEVDREHLWAYSSISFTSFINNLKENVGSEKSRLSICGSLKSKYGL